MPHRYGEGFRDDPRHKRARSAIVTPAEHEKQAGAHTDKPVYQYGFERDGKELGYVGCSHTNDPESPVFAAIREQFAIVRPQKILVEGMHWINDHPMKARKIMKEMGEEEAQRRGEGIYALWLGVQAGIEFESPEPDESTLMQRSKAAGFSEQEIFMTLFYRIMHQYLREHDEPSLEDARKYIIPYFDRFRTSSGFSRESLDRFEDMAFADMDLSKGDFYRDQADPIPWEGAEPSRSKEYSAFLTTERDRYALERISVSLNRHDRILVVYGRSHAVMLEPALQELFRN